MNFSRYAAYCDFMLLTSLIVSCLPEIFLLESHMPSYSARALCSASGKDGTERRHFGIVDHVSPKAPMAPKTRETVERNAGSVLSPSTTPLTESQYAPASFRYDPPVDLQRHHW